MVIWNAYPVLNRTNQIKYIIMPYSLKGVIKTYLKPGRFRRLPDFIRNSRFSEEAVRRYVERRSEWHNDIDH